MDSADLRAMQAAVHEHGAMLHDQQQGIQQVGHNLSSLADSVHALSTQIQQLSLQASSPPAAPASTLSDQPDVPQPAAREPRLPPPQPYNGEPGSCRSFLSQCSLTLELQASAFPTQRSRVAYIITLLTGKAREWGTALWDSDDPICASYNDFTKEMKEVFDRAVSGRDAARQLLQLKQGSRSVFDYAIDFRTLAASCGWGDTALYDAFLSGLSDAVKDELVSQELPTEFKEVVKLASRVDARLRERRSERGLFRPRPRPTTTSLPSPPQETAPPLESMQVDRAKLSPEERLRRRQENACFYCGQVGHLCSKCPLKANAHQ